MLRIVLLACFVIVPASWSQEKEKPLVLKDFNAMLDRHYARSREVAGNEIARAKYEAEFQKTWRNLEGKPFQAVGSFIAVQRNVIPGKKGRGKVAKEKSYGKEKYVITMSWAFHSSSQGYILLVYTSQDVEKLKAGDKISASGKVDASSFLSVTMKDAKFILTD